MIDDLESKNYYKTLEMSNLLVENTKLKKETENLTTKNKNLCELETFIQRIISVKNKLPLKLLITVPILETEDADPIDKFVNMHKTNVKTNTKTNVKTNVKTSKYTKYVRKPNNETPSIISNEDFMD